MLGSVTSVSLDIVNSSYTMRCHLIGQTRHIGGCLTSEGHVLVNCLVSMKNTLHLTEPSEGFKKRLTW